ncbi:MAG TPA: DUF6335 family protein [Vicinamibacterales bacterium]
MAKTKSAKTRGRNRGQKKTAAKRKTAKARASARSAAKRKTAGAKTSKARARRKTAATRATKRKTAKAAKTRKTSAKTRKTAAKARKTSARTRKTTAKARKASSKGRKTAASRKTARPASRKITRKTAKAAKTSSRSRRTGSRGREESLDQTPGSGRTVKGRTNPMPTRRSTGTPAGAGTARQAPGLDRERKQLRELEESIEGPPSSLDMDRSASAARSGRRHLQDTLDDHHETGPAMTGGDIDADWEDAYAVGDEAPGGDNPTPDQDRVDDIGRALGVEYQDNEELKGADKIAERDKHRWELDPASSDDYRDRE